MGDYSGIVVNGKERYVFKNGVKFNIPAHIRANNITTMNNEVFVNGFELMPDGTWRRTIRALWYMMF